MKQRKVETSEYITDFGIVTGFCPWQYEQASSMLSISFLFTHIANSLFGRKTDEMPANYITNFDSLNP